MSSKIRFTTIPVLFLIEEDTFSLDENITSLILEHLNIQEMMDMKNISKLFRISVNNVLFKNKELIDELSNADDVDEKMYYSAKAGILELVKFFHKKGATNWERILDIASIRGNLEIVKYVIEHMKPNNTKKIIATRSINYAIGNAARHGHIDIVKYFFNYHRINKETYINLIEDAGFGGSLEIVKYVLKKRKIHISYLDAGLYGAIRGNHLPLVKFFIEKGATVGKALEEVSNVTHVENMDIVKYIAEKANTEELNKGLISAAKKGKMKTVKFLIKKGATSINDAFLVTMYPNIIDYLVFKGATG